MDLLLLAPEIQEEILYLPPVAVGKDSMTERALRRIVADPDWRKQKDEWRATSELRPCGLGIPPYDVMHQSTGYA